MWEEYREDRDQTKACSHCWKRRSEGVVLRKCARCQAAQYCSKECQKAAWPIHKQRCAYDAQMRAEMPERKRRRLKEVSSWIGNYRNLLADCGIIALDLARDYTVCKDTIFLLTIERHPERGFVLNSADAMSLKEATDLVEVAYEPMNGQLLQANEDAVLCSQLGAFFILWVLVDDEGRSSEYATIPFDARDLQGQTRDGWKVDLFAAMNGDAWMSSIAGQVWEDLKKAKSGSG